MNHRAVATANGWRVRLAGEERRRQVIEAKSHMDGLSDRIFRSQVQQPNGFLRHYIARRAAAGAICQIDPIQAARNFVRMVWPTAPRRQNS